VATGRKAENKMKKLRVTSTIIFKVEGEPDTFTDALGEEIAEEAAGGMLGLVTLGDTIWAEAYPGGIDFKWLPERKEHNDEGKV